MGNKINKFLGLYRASQPKPWPLEKPTVIQFPVNDICNARCQMCHIWEKKLDYQISPAELDVALQNDLYSEVVGVGVNGGEPTLRKDLAELVEVLFRRLPKLKSISLITNALISKKVIKSIEAVGQVVRANDAKLDVMVSLDGVGEVHDLVRGREGNFVAALDVIDYIKESDLVTSYRLGCTIIKDNVYGLHDLHDFALKKGIYIKYRLGIPHQRLYTDKIKEPFDLSLDDKIHIGEFLEGVIQYYEESEQQKYFYRSLIDQIIHNEPRKAGCTWQHRGATISARGELLYCAVESDVLGSVVTEDSKKIYFEGQEHLADIIKNKCDSCAHDYVGLPPAKVMLKGYLGKALKRTGVAPEVLRESALMQPIRKAVRKRRFKKRCQKYDVDCSVGIENHNLEGSKNRAGLNAAESLPHRVMVCGWYGTETLGDKAILGGVVAALRSSLGNIDLQLVSLEPYISELTIQQMPDLAGLSLITVENALPMVDEMDLVVFGGGPLMALDCMVEMVALFEKATLCSVPTIVAGCGVGPFGDDSQNQMIKRLLETSSYRVYRDQKSLENAASLGVNTGDDFVAEDPAFTWIYNNSLENVVVSTEKSKPLTLLLGLREWPFKQYAHEISVDEAKSINDRYEKCLVSALSRLIKLFPDLTILPFPMCTNHFGDDDRWYYRALFRNHPEIASAVDYSSLSRELTPVEALNKFKEADAVLAMRFHSLVFALGLGLPAVAIDYTLGRGKVASLADKHEVPFCSLDEVDEEFIVNNVSDLLKMKKSDYEKGTSVREPLMFTNAMSSVITRLK